MKYRATAVAALAFLASVTHAQTAPTTAMPADLATIRTRLVAADLPPAGPATDALLKSARAYAAGLTPDHTWADVDYADKARSVWLAARHLDRTLLIAKAHACTVRDGHPDPALSAAATGALAVWLQKDPHNPNWWWNEIGTPQLSGEATVLLGPDCPAAVRDGVVSLMKRSVWTKWTGQNLVWGVTNQIYRGLLTNDSSLAAAAYTRLYQEVVVTPKEGIQPDYSFHQHGAQFYSGGYGLDFANYVGRLISFSYGTPFQPPPDTLATYDHFMLDGQAWMTWGPLFDYSALGREITRKGKVATPADWTGGPVSPVGAPYGLAQTANLLSHLPVPRQKEYAAFAARLLTPPSQLGTGNREPGTLLDGHKHFWRSDYTSHRRPGYFFSLKMCSNRLFNAELVNDEGKLSHHLGDGNTFLYRTGREYRDIFPVWDWNKLPGTTAEQPPAGDAESTRAFLDHLLPKGNHTHGTTSFVGGVSDGTYGASAMLLSRASLSAKKSWFFLDDRIVCLGSSIRCDSPNPVATAVEQCFSAGPVTRGPEDRWVCHNHVGYLFPGEHQNVTLTNGPQSGAWADLGTGSSKRLTADVFSLWLNHGTHPDNASYAYVLLPGADPERTAYCSAHPDVEILSRTDSAHAIRDAKLNLTAAVFFSPGQVANLEADHPCILLLRAGRLSACNPANEPLTLHVKVSGRPYTLDLPAGDLAGSTVTIDVR